MARWVKFKKGLYKMLRSLLIDNYDSYTYNLFQLLAEASGVPPLVFKNDEISLEGIVSLVEAGKVHNVVISPGPGTPHSPHDIGVCLDVLRHLPHVPVLGVCLGHQALAAAHGAYVIKAPEPVHGRLSELQHSGHPLLHHIPSGPRQGFDTVRYHSLIVDSQSLPPCLEPIAWTCGSHHAVCLAQHPSSGKYAASSLGFGSQAAAPGQDQAASSASALPAEPHSFLGAPLLSSSQNLAGESCQPPLQRPHPQIIMGLAHRSQPHFGVQFHPESISTRFGCVLLSNFLHITAAHLQLQQPLRLLPAAPEPPGREFPPKPWPTADFLEGVTPLQLGWERLEGLLAPGGPGNTERVFSHLFEWVPCSFWLDR
ncbi:class I glutamine amidotransferase-like protein [Dunaliella salina]|uniref:anthranilate synthase n=1 Tax=Dunaliella salina TaxID=3046 RepID=A0ABQ7GKJ5_DUNSA|nr:class I glutamine amidotransferase-like protein [Dunaliella salina]|eukprot:KAF5835099.1 class I glutamine amidotransferase-like protein [Dunaliella salina]